MLHKLEQVSSDEHIGTMAENLMEALKENQQVKARVSGRKTQWLNGYLSNYLRHEQGNHYENEFKK